MHIALLAFTALLAFAAPAGAANRNFGISGFTKIRVDGPFKVNVATGVAPFARATGSAAALDRVAIDVRGDTLVVHYNVSSWAVSPSSEVGPVEINVGTHELSNAWLNGAGALAIDRVKGLSFGLSVQGSGSAAIATVDADQLKIGLVGSANAKLAGAAKRLTAVVRGVSTLDAGALKTRDATVGVEGASRVDASISNAVSVSASGNATVRFTGRPSCTLKVTGSTSVSGCR
jgi:hypothetical protein